MTSETGTRWSRESYRADDTGWISFGAFLIIGAVIYITTPNIAAEIEAFFRDFELVRVQIFQDITWFVPAHNHPVLYGAVERFCYIFGLVQIGILILRFARGSSVHGKADTLSSIVFWVGLGYLLSLLSGEVLSWLSFLGAFVVLVGISIVAKELILILVPHGPR